MCCMQAKDQTGPAPHHDGALGIVFPCSAVICIFPDTPTKRNLLCANMGCGGSKAEDGDAADHGDVVMVQPHERTGQAE